MYAVIADPASFTPSSCAYTKVRPALFPYIVEIVAVVSLESNSVAYGLEYTLRSAHVLRDSDPVYHKFSA